LRQERKAVSKEREKAHIRGREIRDEIQKLEEEAKKPPQDRKLPEFGSEKDFQLIQALNQLKGLPVVVSKTQTERKEEPKEQ
jgi:carboxyl-terminal processing protease